MGDRIGGSLDPMMELRMKYIDNADSYRSNLKKLEQIMDVLTNSDIGGQPAKDLLTKYEDKKPQFDAITQALNTCDERMGKKIDGFKNLISEISGSMK